jgi:hypothetical protein
LIHYHIFSIPTYAQTAFISIDKILKVKFSKNPAVRERRDRREWWVWVD